MQLAITRHANRSQRRNSFPSRDTIAPGWFVDPASTAHERFWTGDQWTGVVRERDLSFVAVVPGLNRTLIQKSIPRNRWSTRRITVATTHIQWGRWKLPTEEITNVWHWIEEAPNAEDPSKAWTKLVFEAENRVSGMRIHFKRVGGATARKEVWDAYRALISVSTTVVQPRLAVDYLDRLVSGKDVKIGSLRLTSRGIVDRHHDPRRASISAHWDDVTLLVTAEGLATEDDEDGSAAALGLARVTDGSIIGHIDASAKNASVLPLLLWLAKDKFETKPFVPSEPHLPAWDDRFVSS
jgi:hypothetical protein